jgi:SH3 domain/Ras association (RalGDS/AF-6) domain
MNDAIIPDKSPKLTSLEGKRTSVLLNECLFEGEHSFESVRRRTRWPLDRRQSLMQSDELLRRWTERTEVVTNGEHDLAQRSSEEPVRLELNQVSHLFPGTPDPPPALFVRALYNYDAADQVGLSFRQGDIIQVLTQLESGWWDGVINDMRGWFPSNYCVAVSGPDNPGVFEIFKSFRVGLDDPCYRVLPAALRKYNIQADWRQYALYIIYGDQERVVGMDEKPLALFKDLEGEGKKPVFMLRKLVRSMGDVTSAGIELKPPGSGGGAGSRRGPLSLGASVKRMGGQGVYLPGGVL